MGQQLCLLPTVHPTDAPDHDAIHMHVLPQHRYFDTSFPASIMARRLARAAFVAWMPFCVWFGLIDVDKRVDPLVNMIAILDSRGIRLRDRMQLPAAQKGGRPAWPSSVIRKDTAAAPASPEGLDLPASGSGLAQLLSKALSYIPGPQQRWNSALAVHPAPTPPPGMVLQRTAVCVTGAEAAT